MPCVMTVEAVEAESVYVISNHSAVDFHVMYMQQRLSFFQAKLSLVTSEYLELKLSICNFKHSSECGLMVLSS